MNTRLPERIKRLPDWSDRYAAAIGQPRRYSQRYFCASFAADIVEAMTGTDPMSDYRGLTEREARQAVARQHRSLTAYLRRLFGPEIHPSQAHRGDVVVRRGQRGHMLGICVGADAAFLSDSGLDYHPMTEALRAFRI